MKELIRRLHIKEPREMVMKILGVKYPSSLQEFQNSGLAGEWDESRAGKRMKLSAPITWEVMSSREGNRPTMWEKLIEQNKLPFLATLRNLRNMILTGISRKHHDIILERLCKETLVKSSRVMPLQIFKANQSIKINLNKMRRFAKWIVKEHKKMKIAEKIDQTFLQRGIATEQTLKIRKAKRVTKIRDAAKKRFGLELTDTPKMVPSKNLIAEYERALNLTLKFATLSEDKIVSGHTIILCDVSSQMEYSAESLRYMGKKKPAYEAALLIGLLLRQSCETSEFYIFGQTKVMPKINPDFSIYEQVNDIIVNWRKKSSIFQCNFPYSVLDKCIEQRKNVSNLIVISSMEIKTENLLRKDCKNPLVEQLDLLRKRCNKELLFIGIDLKGSGSTIVEMDWNETTQEEEENSSNDLNVLITGFPSNLTQYITSRRSSSQLSHINNLQPDQS